MLDTITPREAQKIFKPLYSRIKQEAETDFLQQVKIE